MPSERRRSGNHKPAIAFIAADSEVARRAFRRLSKHYPQVAPDKADVIVTLGGDGNMLRR